MTSKKKSNNNRLIDSAKYLQQEHPVLLFRRGGPCKNYYV